jgi:hypothetical protein
MVSDTVHRSEHAPELDLDVLPKAREAAVLPVAIDQRPAKLFFEPAGSRASGLAAIRHSDVPPQ